MNPTSSNIQSIINIFFRIYRKLVFLIKYPFNIFLGKFNFFINGAIVGKNLKTLGLIKVIVTRNGHLTMGDNCRLNSGPNFNPIGRQQRCIFFVSGVLEIGNNVAMSSVAIVCKEKIIIGNNVMIGGNTVIYDTDFHSLDPIIRKSDDDHNHVKNKHVIIKDNVFIGAHSTILKGVTIGKNAVVGACSVVTKDIPADEIWAGNPAHFIK